MRYCVVLGDTESNRREAVVPKGEGGKGVGVGVGVGDSLTGPKRAQESLREPTKIEEEG